MKTWVVLNDVQFPFHSPALRLVVQFIKELKPYGVCLNGDITDCYELSEFSKNPLTDATLKKEIFLAQGLMNAVGQYCHERIWLGGNHEDRLRRIMWNRLPELGELEELDFPHIFKLHDYGFAWKPYGGVLKLGKLDVTHGSVIRQHSGWTAKAMFEKRGGSVLHGHTHRLGIYYRTNSKGMHAGYENGCLCRLDPEYVQDPDWQHGFAVIHVGEGGFFHVQQIPIINEKFFFYGKDLVKL